MGVGLGWSRPPQHPLGTHGIPQDTPTPTVTPPPALGASGNGNSGGVIPALCSGGSMGRMSLCQGVRGSPCTPQPHPKAATSGGHPCHGGPRPYPSLALGASALGRCPQGPGSGWSVPLPKKQVPPKAALFSGGEAQITGDGGNVNSPLRNAGAPRGDFFKRIHVLALENRAGIWDCRAC